LQGEKKTKGVKKENEDQKAGTAKGGGKGRDDEKSYNLGESNFILLKGEKRV